MGADLMEPGGVRAFLDRGVEAMVAELAEWVRIPSVSIDPERRMDVIRSANWLAGRLRDMGAPRVEVWDTPGLPAVYAEWCTEPDAPTVLLYGHHDVRAVVEEQWRETAPFEPVLRDGRLYGRGASDAKGQVLCHLWALRAHLATTGRTAPAINVKLLVCGEEESGSEHLAWLLDKHRGELGADAVVFSDTMLWSLSEPAMCTGIRGALKARLTVRGAGREVHAGAVSGAAPNSMTELCRLLAQLHDDTGRITLPRFYDDVREAPEDERKAFATLSFERTAWLEQTATVDVVGEQEYSVLERIWIRPSVEVVGLESGEPGIESRGVLAPSATANLSLNLVPDQRPDRVADQLRAWVAERISPHVEYDLEVDLEKSAEAYVTPDNPTSDALERAMGEAFGAPVARMRNGGTGPAELIARVIGAPVVFFGTGLPDDAWHGPDEKVEVQALLLGAATLAHLYANLAADAEQVRS